MRIQSIQLCGFPFSFHALNVCQFLVTLNDAIARMFIIFYLNDLLGVKEINTILFLTSIVIVLPFLCFGMIGGQFADRYPKGRMIRWLQIFEIAGTIVICGSMFFHEGRFIYVGLFLMAVQAALFAPLRLALIPEIVAQEKIPFANSIITSTNYIALLLGAFIASYMTILTDRNFPLLGGILIIIALLAWVVSLGIHSEKSYAHGPIRWNVFKETCVYLKKSMEVPHLFHVIIYGSYFLLACLFTQLNLIPFGYQELYISDAETGYILLYTSFGLGMGALLYGLVSKKNIEVSYALLGGLGTALAYFGLLIFPKNYLMVSLMGFMIGVSGGFFIVPLNGYIQTRSPESVRASIIAASNTLGFLFLLGGAAFLQISGGVLQFSGYDNFVILAVLTLIMWFAFAYEFRYSLLRPFFMLWMNLLYRVEGKNVQLGGIYRMKEHDWLAMWGLMVLAEPLRIVWDRPRSVWYKRLFLMFCSIEEIDLKKEPNALEKIHHTVLREKGVLVISSAQSIPGEWISYQRKGRSLTFKND